MVFRGFRATGKKEYNLNLYEDLFETLEQEFRDRIVDKIMLYGVFNKKTINRQEQSDTLVHYRNLNAIAESKNEVNLKIISQRKEEIEILKKELQNIYNSRSWKIAMKMRKIKNAIFRFKKY